jgi:hypothetical protein
MQITNRFATCKISNVADNHVFAGATISKGWWLPENFTPCRHVIIDFISDFTVNLILALFNVNFQWEADLTLKVLASIVLSTVPK